MSPTSRRDELDFTRASHEETFCNNQVITRPINGSHGNNLRNQPNESMENWLQGLGRTSTSQSALSPFQEFQYEHEVQEKSQVGAMNHGKESRHRFLERPILPSTVSEDNFPTNYAQSLASYSGIATSHIRLSDHTFLSHLPSARSWPSENNISSSRKMSADLVGVGCNPQLTAYAHGLSRTRLHESGHGPLQGSLQPEKSSFRCLCHSGDLLLSQIVEQQACDSEHLLMDHGRIAYYETELDMTVPEVETKRLNHPGLEIVEGYLR